MLAHRFDQQAALFDQRTGFTPEVAREIAQAVLALASPRHDDTLLELGAGTGALGSQLVDLGARYVGLDLSRGMLDAFRRRLANPRRGLLVLADAEQSWPLQGHSVAVVFASRVVHLLNSGRVLDEVRRVCRPGGLFIIGRTAREQNSLKSRLRDERLRMSTDSGVQRRRHGEGGRRLLELCVASGCAPIPTRTVATWSVSTTAEKIIRDWEAMNASELPYAALRDWTIRELGALDHVETSVERFTLEGVRLPIAVRQPESRLVETA